MSTPIDLDHLDKYILGDRALRDEILTIFIDQTGMLIGRLSAAAGDEAWRIAAHTLKGAARGVGAWTLGDLAEAAERLTDAQQRQRAAILRDIEAAADAAICYAKGIRDRAA